jgi:hypothetical protein
MFPAESRLKRLLSGFYSANQYVEAKLKAERRDEKDRITG